MVSLSGTMFKPFTNTKTCIVFLQKRIDPVVDLETLHGEPDVIYAVTEKPGKDRRGRLVRRVDGSIATDLDEIADYLAAQIDWRVY